jgi:uncharacterized protein YaiE (UPF0345 family)
MAIAETVMTFYSNPSTGIVLDGRRRWGTGKPDEMETLTSGLERGCWKSANW